MAPSYYYYNRKYCLVFACGYLIILAGSVALLFGSHPRSWLYLNLAVIGVILLMLWRRVLIYVPFLINGKPALILDHEKLYHGLKRRSVYWNEINEILPSTDKLGMIRLILKNGREVDISTSAIKEDHKTILHQIAAYFNDALRETPSL